MITEYWKEQTSEDDESSVESETVYKFGLNIGNSNQLTLPSTIAFAKSDKLGVFSKENTKGVFTQDNIGANFALVNGLPFRWLLGKTTSTTEDQRRKIEMPDLTAPTSPRLTVGNELGSNNNQVFGTLFSEGAFQMTIGSIIICSLNGKGLNRTSPEYSVETPVYPDDLDDFYIHYYFKWNTSEIDIVSCKMDVIRDSTGFIGDDGYYHKINECTPTQIAISIGMFTHNADLKADWLAGTKRRCQWKWICPKDTNRYVEIDTASSGATASVESYSPIVDTQNNDIIGYNAVILLEGIEVDVNDYLNDDFYTVPT